MLQWTVYYWFQTIATYSIFDQLLTIFWFIYIYTYYGIKFIIKKYIFWKRFKTQFNIFSSQVRSTIHIKMYITHFILPSPFAFQIISPKKWVQQKPLTHNKPVNFTQSSWLLFVYYNVFSFRFRGAVWSSSSPLSSTSSLSYAWLVGKWMRD